MKILITNDEGKLFEEHEFTDEKLENFCNVLEESDGTTTQKALAFMQLTDDIAKKANDSVDGYIKDLMGWED
jgi:hypothetical protein